MGALTYVGVGVGGSLGAGLRVWLMSGDWGGAFLSLLAANTIGCAAIGIIWRFSAPGRRRFMPAWLSIALMSGLCGALTSYSAAVLMLLQHLGDPGMLKVVLLSGLTVACWLAATLCGLFLGGVLNPLAGRAESTHH